jgi:two-component system response regulator QseB
MRILMIDSTEWLPAIADRLRANGYSVDTAADGEKGLHLACTANYDLIILDFNLPIVDGVELVRLVRSEGHQTRIMFLSTFLDTTEKILGLRAGADDCQPKSLTFDELLARIAALTRRT